MLAAPIYQVSPLMGSNLIIVVFAVVVVGGMGSILGAIVTGYMLGVLEGLTKVFYPEASNIVIFVIMAIVLLVRPAGLFGTGGVTWLTDDPALATEQPKLRASRIEWLLASAVAALLAAPFFFYPVFLMSMLCFALFACAFNLLSAIPACCPSAMPPSSAARPISPPMPSRSGAWSRELGILARRRSAQPCWAWSSASSPSAARASTSR